MKWSLNTLAVFMLIAVGFDIWIGSAAAGLFCAGTVFAAFALVSVMREKR